MTGIEKERARKEQLRALGFCASCGDNRAPRGTSCDACKTYQRERSRIVRAARRRLVHELWVQS